MTGAATALIGSTGFVGGSLRRRTRFDALFHSADIERIAGRRFDRIVCAGAPAEKWRANQDPAADRRNLERLVAATRRADAERMILISTIDVYGRPAGDTEADPPSGGSAYGENRLWLERAMADRFRTTIVRLPGLFGPGLKKNAIYDLLHGNQVDRIDPRSTYQFYDVNRLWSDIETAERAGLSVVHLVTEPVTMQDVAFRCFGIELRTPSDATPAAYDLRTRHAGVFGGRDGYLLDARSVLEGISMFVREERELRPCG